jgi:hypothetical protein
VHEQVPGADQLPGLVRLLAVCSSRQAMRSPGSSDSSC